MFSIGFKLQILSQLKIPTDHAAFDDLALPFSFRAALRLIKSLGFTYRVVQPACGPPAGDITNLFAEYRLLRDRLKAQGKI
jgi:hypothetical protein